MCVAGGDPDFSVFLGRLSLAQDPCVRSFPFCRRSLLSAAHSSPIFFSFFLWFWKLVLEKRKSVVMLVLSSVSFLFPCPPLCLCSQRKKETLWFLEPVACSCRRRWQCRRTLPSPFSFLTLSLSLFSFFVSVFFVLCRSWLFFFRSLVRIPSVAFIVGDSENGMRFPW